MLRCGGRGLYVGRRSKDEKFYVSLEQCISPRLCLQCDRTISPGSVYVREAIDKTRSQYHLNCYQPIPSVRYSLPTVNVSISPFSHLTSWPAVEAHNVHFTARFIVTPMKRLNFPRTKPVRVLLEVFKYLDPIRDVGAVAGVNSTWYEVSWMEELWLCYSNALSQNKVHFIERWMRYCGECRNQTIADFAQLVCPLTRRPICRTCASKNDYAICCVIGNPSYVPCIKQTGRFALTLKKFR